MTMMMMMIYIRNPFAMNKILLNDNNNNNNNSLNDEEYDH